MTTYTDMTIAEIIHDFATVRGDLNDRGAREDLAAVIERRVASVWDEGHRLGEALAYNAVGDVLWERHRDVIGRADYRVTRAARAIALPHWDTNPYRTTTTHADRLDAHMAAGIGRIQPTKESTP